MSAVDRVRETARLMRERAEGARAGRWSRIAGGVFAPWGSGIKHVAICDGSLPEGNRANAEHIASLDPEVAQRIADLLDVLTDADWPYLECDDDPCEYGPCVLERRAQALADAYLGAKS